ncbi:hypothetical protein F5Y16DRAFT_418380 [Xylariaceae sp. FL0255]|nr:hypothetical protein F5Y16DRAFT_418380 [Xylariaceae sp. FL0255]
MDVFAQHLQKTSLCFLKGDPACFPEIQAVFLGGSRVYHANSNSGCEGDHITVPSYDSTVVVRTKKDIYTLLNDADDNGWRRKAFANLMGIEKESGFEGIGVQVPDPTSPLWSEFDAVRFAGCGAESDGDRSITILNLVDIFRKETINILTFKDKRVYRALLIGGDGRLVYEWSLSVAQTTSLQNGLKIQHTQWLYDTNTSHQVQGHGGVELGPLADLLLSSICLYDQHTGLYGYNVKRIIAERYVAKCGGYPTLHAFYKYPCFVSAYKMWLALDLVHLFRPFAPDTVGFANIASNDEQWQVVLGENSGTDLLFGLGTTTTSSPSSPSDDNQVSDETLNQFSLGHFTDQEGTAVDGAAALFGFQSKSYRARTHNGADIFVKLTKNANSEISGAKLAAKFLPRVRIPRLGQNGELIYPLFKGAAKSEIRLKYIESGYKDRNIAQRLLYAEMAQAEDFLRAYRLSLTLMSPGSGSGSGDGPYRIQRYFHDRLVGETRLTRYYPDGVRLPGIAQKLTIDQFLALRWRIDGQSYGTLREAIDYASSVLAPASPHMQACPTVFGVCDGHGGNVMLSDDVKGQGKAGGASDVIYIDFEDAEITPLMLELVKPLWADILMFEPLFRHMANCKSDLGCAIANGTRCSVIGDEIVVELTPNVDPLGQAMLNIKAKYLIEPLGIELQKRGGNLEDHVAILAVGFFVCALMTPNLSKCPLGLIEKVASGFFFLRARNWADNNTSFQKLGFRA